MDHTEPRPVFLLGAIGDALGVPYEQAPGADPIQATFDLDDLAVPFVDSAYHKTKAGQWSDDTGMVLTLAKYLVRKKTRLPVLDGDGILAAYRQWMDDNPHLDKCIGGTIRKAVENHRAGLPGHQCGIQDSTGSGTAMRVAPLGVVYARELSTVLNRLTTQEASLTHKSLEAYAGSYLVARLISLGLIGVKFRTAVEMAMLEVPEYWKTRVFQNTEAGLREYIPHLSGGMVYETVPAAISAITHHKSVAQILKAAVLPGGDADTRAAIAGNILGAWTTIDQVPTMWIATVVGEENITDLDYQTQKLGKVLP